MSRQIDFTPIEDTSGKPTYNTGLGAVFALRDLLNNYHSAINAKQYSSGFSILYSVYVELSPRMSEKEKEAHKKLRKKVQSALRVKSSHSGVMNVNTLNDLNDWAVELMQVIHNKKLGIVDSVGMSAGAQVN